MSDRFLCGFIAGFSADIIKNGLNFFSFYILRYAKIRYLDFAGILLMAHRPEQLVDQVVALVAEFFWASLLGAAFAYLIAHSPKNHLFKSTIFGLSIWFMAYAVTTLYKVPELTKIDINTTISNLFTSATYGFSLGIVLKWFEKKYRPE